MLEPPPPIRRLRDLTRYRIDLVNTRGAEKNRVEKLLEDAQIKLSVVASDIFGVSGRDMMAALIAGQRDPKILAQLARSRMRTKIALLEEAFTGHFTDHHAFLLSRMLGRIDAIDTDIAAIKGRIDEVVAPFAQAVTRLDDVPGIGSVAAAVIIAEIGTDMTRFPTPGHLVSWARFAPGVEESRRGKERALVAVGRSILVIVWHLLADPESTFHDLGPGFYNNRTGPERIKRHHIRQLEALGYTVSLEPVA
ncbi:MAG TPA: transposase [Pseudonocardia sp.]|nr:transposase [Pseudonocardia sp.]